MTDQTHISGIIVHARPGFEADVEMALTNLAGAEIHASQSGKYVVTLESDTAGHLADSLTFLNTLDGVYMAAMVYHANDDLPVLPPIPSSPLPSGDFLR